MQLFLAQIQTDTAANLPPEEARHCLKVLRHQVGDHIHCIDGKGHMYEARITRAHRDEVLLDLLRAHPGWGEHGGHLRLAASPLRLRDRFEWLLEKAVELGASEIVPVLCQRTDKYKGRFKTARAETILLTATKQCLRSVIPILREPISLKDWLDEGISGDAFLAVAQATESLTDRLHTVAECQEVTLLIGPEGDFTDDEQAWAREAGFAPVHLGKTRLRTETAGVYALAQVKAAWGY